MDLEPSGDIRRLVKDRPDDGAAFGRVTSDPVSALLRPPPSAPEQGGIGERRVVEERTASQKVRARPFDAVGQVVYCGVTAALGVMAGKLVQAFRPPVKVGSRTRVRRRFLRRALLPDERRSFPHLVAPVNVVEIRV